MRRLTVAVAGAVLLGAPCSGPARAGDVEVHYAPEESLERIDVDLIRSARTKIDMAAYSLTDWAVVDALIEARRRGGAVRIVLDPSQQHALDRLRPIAGDSRMKPSRAYMHLKSYAVDRRVLRSGSANLSALGTQAAGQRSHRPARPGGGESLRGALPAAMGGVGAAL